MKSKIIGNLLFPQETKIMRMSYITQSCIKIVINHNIPLSEAYLMAFWHTPPLFSTNNHVMRRLTAGPSC